MDVKSIAKLFIIAGGVLIGIGLLLYASNKAGFFGLGRLPGDIRIERDNFRLYIPITTSIVISAIISLVIYLIVRFR